MFDGDATAGYISIGNDEYCLVVNKDVYSISIHVPT